jgi:hypothetical protein
MTPLTKSKLSNLLIAIHDSQSTSCRPARRVLAHVNQNHPNRPRPDLGRKFVRRLACHGSTFSRVGASGNPAAVHPPSPRNERPRCHSGESRPSPSYVTTSPDLIRRSPTVICPARLIAMPPGVPASCNIINTSNGLEAVRLTFLPYGRKTTRGPIWPIACSSPEPNPTGTPPPRGDGGTM